MKKWMIPLLLALALLTGCGGETTETTETTETIQEEQTAETAEVPSASADVFAMDTYMTVTCYGERCEEALKASIVEISRLENLLSVSLADSEVGQLNANGSGVLSEDTRIMVEKALELHEQTGGAFDITVYPLMELWGFISDEFQVPSEAELAAVLETTGAEKLAYDTQTAMLDLGGAAGIDLGGIAKGYTSDRLMEVFAEYDLVCGLVSLGGNVQCYGSKPDGTDWRCGIQDPFAADGGSSLMGVLAVSNRAVITSGAYERYFTDESGNTYHHILEPETGLPAESGLVSVTIVSDCGMLADGLSTSIYVMGLEEATAYWQLHSEEFDMILMTDAGEVYVTESLEGSFTTEYPLHIIEKEGT